MYPIIYKKKCLDVSQKDPIYKAVDALLTLITVLTYTNVCKINTQLSI